MVFHELAHEQKRSRKALLIAALIGKELPSFAELEGEMSVFRLLPGYYGHKRKYQGAGIAVSLPLSSFRVVEEERSCFAALPLPRSGRNRSNLLPSGAGVCSLGPPTRWKGQGSPAGRGRPSLGTFGGVTRARCALAPLPAALGCSGWAVKCVGSPRAPA